MRKLTRIMQMNNPTRENLLLKLAKELGASTIGWGSRGEDGITEDILVERIQRAYVTRNAHRMWLVALISAIASLLSAVAAWTAIINQTKVESKNSQTNEVSTK